MLSGVLSEWQPADMQSKKSNQTKNHLKVINDDHPLPDCLRKYTALPYHAPENCGGSFPMKDIQHSHTTKSSDVCSQEGTASSETQKKKTMHHDSCSRGGVRAGRGSSCASPLGYRSLDRALVSAPFQSVPLLPRSNKQKAPRSFRCWSEGKKISRRVSSTRLCPDRRRSISLLHCRRIQPPDGAVPSMQA